MKIISNNNDLLREFVSLDKVDWKRLAKDYLLSESFINEYQRKLDWDWVSIIQKLSESFIEKFQKKLNWKFVSYRQTLSESFIEKFQDKVNWDGVSSNQILSEEFIKKFQRDLNWRLISENQNLSESFIDKFQNKVDWISISQFQTLSEEFIDKFKDKVDLYFISSSQDVSDKFIEQLKKYKKIQGDKVLAKLKPKIHIYILPELEKKIKNELNEIKDKISISIKASDDSNDLKDIIVHCFFDEKVDFDAVANQLSEIVINYDKELVPVFKIYEKIGPSRYAEPIIYNTDKKGA